MPGKREDVISWDEFFMRAAVAASLRSKDPNTQVGACIADTNNPRSGPPTSAGSMATSCSAYSGASPSSRIGIFLADPLRAAAGCAMLCKTV